MKMDIIETYLNEAVEDYYIQESKQDAVAKEIAGMNKIFRNKLKKNKKITYEIHKASKGEKIGYKFASGYITNKEKSFGGVWVITLYGDDNKKIGKYYTCNFKNSDIDADLKSKVKAKK